MLIHTCVISRTQPSLTQLSASIMTPLRNLSRKLNIIHDHTSFPVRNTSLWWSERTRTSLTCLRLRGVTDLYKAGFRRMKPIQGHLRKIHDRSILNPTRAPKLLQEHIYSENLTENICCFSQNNDKITDWLFLYFQKSDVQLHTSRDHLMTRL